jgi:hypothetical protein
MSTVAVTHTRPSAVTLAGVACLAGIAVTHLADLSDKLREAHYMAALFCGLIVASLVLAGALLAGVKTREAWRAGAVLSALTIVGYVLSRSVGLPQLADHVGMWWDPWGVAAVICEAGLIALAVQTERARRAR